MAEEPNLTPTILLVEDERGIIVLLRRVLRDLARNYAIVACTDGRQALDELARHPVALVITDYRMPELDGLQLARIIKTHSPRLPVVMISAYAHPDLIRRARETGVDRFIAKPFTVEVLEEVIADALGLATQ